MFCEKCGSELPDNARFCAKCGAKVVSAQAAGEKEQVNRAVKTINDEKVIVIERHKGKMMAGIALGVIAVIMVVALAFMKIGKDNGFDITGTETDTDVASLHLYDVTLDEIDIYAEKRQPNTRDFSLLWDKSLFYTLEDVTPEDTDGQIEKYDICRRELINAQNGNKITYEIYTNPDTSKINKIVSIEEQGNVLEITDYYYLDNGQPDFIYQRTDSIYTPTYATQNKTGERYYFKNDTLVKWRWIDVPLEVEEISLGVDAESSAQTQYLFNEIDAGTQEEFNQREIQMLNAAYNTYEAMENSSDYANIKGYVLDTNGNTLTGVTIDFYAGDEVIGSVMTDENGYYETGISLYNAGYNLEISCDGYADATIYKVVVDKANVTNWIGNVYLTPKVKQKCSVSLNVYDADAISYNDGESITKNGVAEASVIVRTGVNNTTGKSVAEANCDGTGNVTLELNVGIYTIETSVNGYISSYETLVVDTDKAVDIPLTKEVSGNQMKVVLTWEGNVDLDSCLFTPYKADDGDMAHINAINSSDLYGNALLADSKDGNAPEVITIEDCTDGTYKYYVSDYNNCLNGNLTATDMQNLNVRVTIYDKNGIVATYTLPYNQSGVIWEVFEVKNGKVVTLQHSYSNLEGKNWWSVDKENLDIEACEDLKQVLYLVASWNYSYITNDTENAIEVLKENPRELFYFACYSINNGINCVPYCETPHYDGSGYSVGETSVELLNRIYNSLTADTYDFSFEVGKDEEGICHWNEEYLLYMGADGSGWVDSLKNYSVMRDEDGLWQVTAEYWGYNENTEPAEQKVTDITFTLKRNPSSIFNGYSIVDIDITNENLALNARYAYYDVLVNGAPLDGGDTMETLSPYLQLDGGWDFILKDINGDGIEELLICESSGCLLDYLPVEKIWFIFGYEDECVKVLYTEVTAACNRGYFVLNNNKMVSMYWISPTMASNGEEFPSEDDISIFDWNGGQPLIEYRVCNRWSDPYFGDIEYFINDKLVSEEEWYASMQSNIIEKMIPQKQYWALNKENLYKELLGWNPRW